MRICLISPGHLSTNPRLVKEADALSQAGYEVTVIAAAYQPWAMDADRSFAARAWKRVQPVRFGPHAPPALRISQLVRHGFARVMTRAGLRHPALDRTALHQAAPDLVAAARRVAADLYIAHYPAALPAAALAAKRHGGLYAFDAEDFHQGALGLNPAGQRERRLIVAIEETYLSGCAYVTAASSGIALAYSEAYGVSTPTVVLNVFPSAQGPDCARPRGSTVPGPSVYWFSQTIGPQRGLETAIAAIGLSKSRPHLYMRGVASEGFAEQMLTLANTAKVGDRVHILAPASPPEMERLAAAHDVGLSAETGHNLNNRIALGNKVFSYLLAGIPIVASDVPSHRQLAPALGEAIRLFSADDSASLATAIDDLLLHPSTLANARAEAFRLARERYNWEIEQSVLIDCVDRALASRDRRAA